MADGGEPAKPAPRKSGQEAGAPEVRTGIAHVQATFNNTIVTLTDKMGNVVVVGERGQRGLQGLAQEHAVRGADRGRERGPQGDGDRAQAGRGLRARARAPGREAAIRSLQAVGLEITAIRDVTPDSAQRLPAAQAAAGVGGDGRGAISTTPCAGCAGARA